LNGRTTGPKHAQHERNRPCGPGGRNAIDNHVGTDPNGTSASDPSTDDSVAVYIAYDHPDILSVYIADGRPDILSVYIANDWFACDCISIEFTDHWFSDDTQPDFIADDSCADFIADDSCADSFADRSTIWRPYVPSVDAAKQSTLIPPFANAFVEPVGAAKQSTLIPPFANAFVDPVGATEQRAFRDSVGQPLAGMRKHPRRLRMGHLQPLDVPV